MHQWHFVAISHYNGSEHNQMCNDAASSQEFNFNALLAMRPSPPPPPVPKAPPATNLGQGLIFASCFQVHSVSFGGARVGHSSEFLVVKCSRGVQPPVPRLRAFVDDDNEEASEY